MTTFKTKMNILKTLLRSVSPSTGKTIICWYSRHMRPHKTTGEICASANRADAKREGSVTHPEEGTYQVCGNEDSAMKLLQLGHGVKTLVLIHVA